MIVVSWNLIYQNVVRFLSHRERTDYSYAINDNVILFADSEITDL